MGERPRDQEENLTPMEAECVEKIRTLKEKRVKDGSLSRTDEGLLKMWQRTLGYTEAGKAEVARLGATQETIPSMTSEQMGEIIKTADDKHEAVQREIKEGSERIYKKFTEGNENLYKKLTGKE